MNVGNKISPIYTAAIVIVHGESENIIIKHIKSKLRLKIHIHKGTTSIQINGLLKELNTYFKNISQLKKSGLDLNIDKKSGEIINEFCIFTFMDTDDCTEETKRKYIDGSLFSGYALKEYVKPIYSIPDLEEVLYKSRLIPKKYNDSEKVKEYGKWFPISREPHSDSKMPIKDMEKMCGALVDNKQTNLDELLKYCIEQAKKNEAKRR